MYLLIKHSAMKACWESGGIAPHILNLSTRWRWSVSFMPQPLCPWGKSPQHPLEGGWVGPRANVDAVAKRRNPFVAPAWNWILFIHSHSVVTVLTDSVEVSAWLYSTGLHARENHQARHIYLAAICHGKDLAVEPQKWKWKATCRLLVVLCVDHA
jgi:hypothetical protein